MIEEKCPVCHKSILFSERRRSPHLTCPHCNTELMRPTGKSTKNFVISRSVTYDNPAKTARNLVPAKTRDSSAAQGHQHLPPSIATDSSKISIWPVIATFLLAVFVCASVAAWFSNHFFARTTFKPQTVLEFTEKESSTNNQPNYFTEKKKRKEDFLLQQIMRSRAVFPAAASAEIAKPANHVARAVVTIVATGSSEHGLGSGFVVNRNDWIITSLNVITGFNACEALTRSPEGTVNETRTITGFVGCDKSADVVVLALDKRWPADPLPLKRDGLIGLIGSRVFGVAALDGSTNYVIDGCFLGNGTAKSFRFEGIDKNIKLLQTDIPFTAGLRGGPLCNMKGDVLGIMVPGTTVKESDSSEKPNQWLHAIAAEELGSILSRCAKQPKPLSKLPRYR